MDIKNPTTYQQQIEILRNHGCTISDEGTTVDFLERVGFYRFSGYFSVFKGDHGRFHENVTFEKMASVYAFDQELRSLVIRAVSEIEIAAKSTIAYYHGHKYGTNAYLDIQYFGDKRDQVKFNRQLESAVRNNSNSPIVKHHMKKYQGSFPLWVVMELFTMGMVSLFYADLQTPDKKVIASKYKTDYTHLQSWLHGATVLRNISAHYGRLYPTNFHQFPKLPRKYGKNNDIPTHSLGRQLCMLKLLHVNCKDDWNHSFVLPSAALIEKYDDIVDIKKMGLPHDWEKVLTW